jgi:hypothetical protein
MQRMREQISAVFGDESVLNHMRTALAENDGPIDERRRALTLLKRVGDTASNPIYVRLLDDDQLRGDVIPLISQTGESAAAMKLLELFPMLDGDQRTAAFSVLTSRPEFALVLLHAVDEKSFERKNLTALQIRQMSNLGNEEVNALLEKVWGTVGTSSEDARLLIAKIRNTYSTAPLWAFSQERGAETYKKTCAKCHPLDGSTVPLGPGLAGSWRNGLDYFLENVTDPNAVVGENYRTTVITTTSGTVISGLLDSETDSAISSSSCLSSLRHCCNVTATRFTDRPRFPRVGPGSEVPLAGVGDRPHRLRRAAPQCSCPVVRLSELAVRVSR